MAYYRMVQRGGLGSYSPMVQRGGLGDAGFYAMCADTDPYSTAFCDDGMGNIISRGDWNPILTQPNPVTPPLPPTTTDAQGVPIVGVQPPTSSSTGDGTYTLPVEIFNQQLPPVTIPVTAPQPTMAPIPTTLPTPTSTMTTTMETGASIGLLILAVLGLWMTASPKREK